MLDANKMFRNINCKQNDKGALGTHQLLEIETQKTNMLQEKLKKVEQEKEKIKSVAKKLLEYIPTKDRPLRLVFLIESFKEL